MSINNNFNMIDLGVIDLDKYSACVISPTCTTVTGIKDRILSIFLAIIFSIVLLLLILYPISIFAETPPLITFDGNKEAFVFDETDKQFDEVFSNIAPGETRSLSIKLQNNSEKKLNFYFSVKALKDLKELNGAKYHIVIKQDKTSLYDKMLDDQQLGLVGLDTSMGDASKYFPIGTLLKGESKGITFQLTLDGSSTDNNFQNGLGIIQFQFRADGPEGTSIPTLTTKSNPIKTGDTSNLLVPLICLLGSGTLIVRYIISCRKKGNDSEAA